MNFSTIFDIIRNIIKKGGNAVDSIISTLLCMGVTIPESMGLGGGSFIIVYNGIQISDCIQ